MLDDIDLRIPAGSTVALVGSSGAGKTTLADVLMGLHPPTAGRVAVDGVDIRTDIVGWQRSIGMVPQDVYVLDATLRANVAFGEAPDAVNERRLSAALTRAQLDDLIAELPNGVDTIVGERGGRLSGGQRQRIGIARALYLEPSVLVLDEATSALDSETERRITDTIESLRGQMTVVVIAHRLSTVRNCDLLLYLEQGRIAASGTFESVIAESPAFARLVKLGSARRRSAGVRVTQPTKPSTTRVVESPLDYPRVLHVGHHPIGAPTNSGLTLGTMFGSWPDSELLQVCTRAHEDAPVRGEVLMTPAVAGACGVRAACRAEAICLGSSNSGSERRT